MENTGFSFNNAKIAFLAVTICLITLTTCTLVDDITNNKSDNNIISGKSYKKTVTGRLSNAKWYDTLDEIAEKGAPVELDLSECTYPDDALSSAVFYLGRENGKDYTSPQTNQWDEYVIFNPSVGDKDGKKWITSIILPDQATMIKTASDNLEIGYLDDANKEELHSYAFRNFSNLKSVTGNNVRLIGTFAFYKCETLTEANFPEVIHVLQFAFAGCTALKEVNFDLYKTLMPHAFEGCTSLKKVEFRNLEVIGQCAFRDCKNLEEVILHKVYKIGDQAFKDCTSLKTARFYAKPDVETSDFMANFTHRPSPLLDDGMGIVFYPFAFMGCRSLNMLDISYALNVYFATGALAEIGETLDLYLYDEDDIAANANTGCYGHPQQEQFLGARKESDLQAVGFAHVTLKTLTIRVPRVDNSKIVSNNTNGEDNDDSAPPEVDPTTGAGVFKDFIRSNYNNQDLTIKIIKS